MTSTAADNYFDPALDLDLLIHQQNLQLFGVAVPGMEPFEGTQGEICFRELRLRFRDTSTTREGVSLKLPVAGNSETPYAYLNDALYYHGAILDFKGVDCIRLPLPEEEDNWHYKGYTFPYRGTENPFEELRLNFMITGRCPGRCKFCHRWHSYRTSINSCVHEPVDLISEIQRAYGRDLLSSVKRVLVITELMGSESKFLQFVAKARNAIDQSGFAPDVHFGCCAQDVRSYAGLKQLAEQVNPSRYSFSLEAFENRKLIMGGYKGISMEAVTDILSNARKAGFEEIQINYIAGLDSVRQFTEGFIRLKECCLIDSIGLSTFTAFTRSQRALRHEQAWNWTYYEELTNLLNNLGVKTYNPDGYDMRTPFICRLQPI